MAFNTFPTSSPWPPLELANDLNENFSKTVEVSLSTNPVDGAVLVYDASADIWTDGQETVTLDDLTNVVLDTAPTDGDILTYDASSDTWINSPAVTYSLEGLDNVSISTSPTDGSALVYDASSDTWIDGEAAGGDPTINSQTGTSYTLVIGDAYNTVSMDNASANTLTIPTNASVAFDVGTVIAVIQEGAGTTTVSGDTGVTVNGTSAGSEDIGTQYAGAALVKVGTDEWVVTVGGGSGGGGGSTTLDGLTDVVLSTTPEQGAMLEYDVSSDSWVDTVFTTEGVAKAKLSYDQTVPEIDESYNISSVTDNSSGQSQANFTNNFSNTTYQYPSTTKNGGTPIISGRPGQDTTSSYQLLSSDQAENDEDAQYGSTVFGDLA